MAGLWRMYTCVRARALERRSDAGRRRRGDNEGNAWSVREEHERHAARSHHKMTRFHLRWPSRRREPFQRMPYLAPLTALCSSMGASTEALLCKQEKGKGQLCKRDTGEREYSEQQRWAHIYPAERRRGSCVRPQGTSYRGSAPALLARADDCATSC
jgi:hypothetical protein